MTKFLAALGKCDYIKLNNIRYGFWDFLEHQPDGWLLSLAFNHAIVPPVESWCIRDCGAYSYRNNSTPTIRNQIVNASWAIDRYKERSLPGDMVIAPDQMLIDDIDNRRQFNITEAAEFIKLAQSQLPGRKPMAVCHGIDINERIEYAKQLTDMGYNAIAIGGMAINGKEIAKNLEIVESVKSSIPQETWIHVLGLCAPEYISNFAKLGINSCDGSTHVREAIAGQVLMADGANLIRHQATKNQDPIAPLCNCKVCWILREQHGIDTRTFGSNQHNLGRAIHNLNELIKAQRSAMDNQPLKIALVACVSQKLDYPAAARELYVSQWFKAAREYVESQQIPWYILSAKYGVIHPNQVIAPYDETLNEMPIEQRRQWGNRVFHQLHELDIAGSDVVILAGKKYREFIVPALSTISCNCQVPMEHLGIGEQVQWLQAHISTNDTKASGDNADIDAKLFHALHSYTNATERWKLLKSKGASDEELNLAIGNEFGIGGASSSDDCSYAAGDSKKYPKFWDNFFREGKPTLQGKALVRKVRSLLGIPLPSEVKDSSGDNDPYAPGKFVKLVVSRNGWRKGKHYKIVEAIAGSDYLKLEGDANAQDNGFLKDVHVISLDKVDSVSKKSNKPNDGKFNPDAISYVEFTERIKTWLTHHCHDSVLNEIDIYWEIELRQLCCNHFIQTCGDNFNSTNFNKAWESVILELCPNLIKPSISITSLSSTPSLEGDADLESQPPNSISESLDLLKSMNSAINYSVLDSPELPTMEMSIISQESTPPSSVEVHHVNHLVSMEKDSVVSINAMDSQDSLDSSKQVNQLFSCLRMSPDCSLVPLHQGKGKAHTLNGYKGSFPTSGTISNGLLYQAECLSLPGLEKDFLWLESPGALSYSGKTNPPGGDKLSECLRNLGILNKGFVPNAVLIEKAFNLPDGWTNPSLPKAATELIEVADKSSVIRLIGALLSWDSCDASIGLESSNNAQTTYPTYPTFEKGSQVFSDRLIAIDSKESQKYVDSLIKRIPLSRIIERTPTHIVIRNFGVVIGECEFLVSDNPNSNSKTTLTKYMKVCWDDSKTIVYILPDEIKLVEIPQSPQSPQSPSSSKHRFSHKGFASGWIEKQTKYKKLISGKKVAYEYYYYRWQVKNECFGRRIPNELVYLVEKGINDRLSHVKILEILDSRPHKKS